MTHLMNKVHARRAARTRLTTRFITPPEPRTIGSVERGRQLTRGHFLFSGLLVKNPRISIWDVGKSDAKVNAEIHGCLWLDDLAALGTEPARDQAQEWVHDWIARFGNGRGPGWAPDITGRRLIRLIYHGEFLLRGRATDTHGPFFDSLARQTLFLARRWSVMPPGLPRHEALTGAITAGVSLEGLDRYVDPAVRVMADDCDKLIDQHGGIAGRNPEMLLDFLTLMNWTTEALLKTNRRVPPQITRAVERIAPTLRALRHADGSLARFHGGGRGRDGQLDQALAGSGVKDLPEPGLHMGFARLTGGRTTLIVDAAKPPAGAASADGHAGTLGFELTSGRRPVIVNCGSGARFGTDWRRASRATSSHSTLGIKGASSSHLEAPGRRRQQVERLRDCPSLVRGEHADGDARTLEMSHNGYQPDHGLTHGRILTLSVDGRTLDGQDLLTTLDADDEKRFDAAQKTAGLSGINWLIRFHLHPDVTATLNPAKRTIFLALKSGETWLFQHDGGGQLDLQPSVYLEKGRLKPVHTQQVVLSGRCLSYATRVHWSLAKAHDTPDVVRDLVQTDQLDTVQ